MADRLAGNGNLILRALAPEDAALLRPHLERVSVRQGERLVRANEQVDHAYFLDDGIASVLSGSRTDPRIEIAVIGYEGVIGTSALIGDAHSPNDTVVQVGNAAALRIPAPILADAFERSPSLRRLLLTFIQTLLVQIASNAVGYAADRLHTRLARWLLMCHDRTEGDEIALTHEFMAAMIGAQRSAVTHALHEIEGGGLIRATRGRIHILDRTGLLGIAGAGYGDAESEYRRLIGPFGKSQSGHQRDTALATGPLTA